jgi:beta-galactosidase/beta-glucuronidase
LDEVLNVKDLNLLQWIGANSFRTSHYPYSEELMRLADREGFVVIDETPAVGLHLNFGSFFGGSGKPHKTWEELGTKEHHVQVIRELIARDKNHPCVVMWSIANESASEEEGAHEYFQPFAGFHDTTPVMFSEEYQVACLKANHEVVDEFPNFIGEQVWHFTDFQTSQGVMRVQGNKKGVFTRERKPKMAAHYLRERWMAIPDFGYKP